MRGVVQLSPLVLQPPVSAWLSASSAIDPTTAVTAAFAAAALAAATLATPALAPAITTTTLCRNTCRTVQQQSPSVENANKKKVHMYAYTS